MEINKEIKQISDEIIKQIDPQKIILYGKKISASSDKIKEISLCIIITSGDVKKIEKQIYLNISSDLPYNIIIYTAEEWNRFCNDTTSYAHAIKEKGVVLYDEKTSR